MTKYLISSLLLSMAISFAPKVFAKENLLLQCLAKEEEFIIKTRAPLAYAKLNQELVNELASSNDIMIKQKYIDEICRTKTSHPSVHLLKTLLINENQIYDLNFTDVPDSLKLFKLGYINEFQKQVPRIFTQFVSGIQAEMPTPDCLEKYIPELKVFNEKMKYLEDESGTIKQIKNTKQIEKIFDRLKDIKELKQKCNADLKKRNARKTKGQ